MKSNKNMGSVPILMIFLNRFGKDGNMTCKGKLFFAKHGDKDMT